MERPTDEPPGTGGRAPRRPEDRTLASRLAALKRRGCSLLVVTDAASADHACRRALGHPEERRRRLFLATTTTVSSVLQRHGPERDPAALGVVDATAAGAVRSAARPARPGDVDPAADWYDAVETLDLAALGEATTAHLDRFERAGPLAPGEVRLCLESLDPLLDAAEPLALFRFLHLLTARVRSLRGIAHVHAAATGSREPLAAFEPLFDVVVEVRAADGGREQRWRLRESGYDSGWIPFDDGSSL